MDSTTDRHTGRTQTDGWTGRQAGRHTDRWTDGEMDRTGHGEA